MSCAQGERWLELINEDTPRGSSPTRTTVSPQNQHASPQMKPHSRKRRKPQIVCGAYLSHLYLVSTNIKRLSPRSIFFYIALEFRGWEVGKDFTGALFLATREPELKRIVPLYIILALTEFYCWNRVMNWKFSGKILNMGMLIIGSYLFHKRVPHFEYDVRFTNETQMIWRESASFTGGVVCFTPASL